MWNASLVKMAILQQQPNKGLIESANCEGSVLNAKTPGCTALHVRSHCAWYHTLKHIDSLLCVVPQLLAFWHITNHCFYWCIAIYYILCPHSRPTKWYMLWFTVNKSQWKDCRIEYSTTISTNSFSNRLSILFEQVVPMRCCTCGCAL